MIAYDDNLREVYKVCVTGRSDAQEERGGVLRGAGARGGCARRAGRGRVRAAVGPAGAAAAPERGPSRTLPYTAFLLHSSRRT